MRLPDGDERGFRFHGLDRKERYYPYAAMRAEAAAPGSVPLAEAGLDQGRPSRVAVCPENHEFVLTFLGASGRRLRAGADVPGRRPSRPSTPTSTSLAHIVRTSGGRRRRSSAWRRNRDDASTSSAARPSDEVSRRVLGLRNEAFEGDRTPSFSNAPRSAPDDLCFLQFTSGSTSKPKGVIVTPSRTWSRTPQRSWARTAWHRTPDDVGRRAGCHCSTTWG